MPLVSHRLGGRRQSVFFDLDGVLIESHTAILRSTNDTLRAAGLPELGDADGLAIIGSPIKTVFEHILVREDGNTRRLTQCVAAFRQTYERLFMDGTSLQPGVYALIEDAALRMPIAVATTKPAHIADAILTELRIREFFTVVCGPSALAEGETKRTTLGRAIDEVSRLSADPVDPHRSLMVGDRHHDIDAARTNGIPVVGVLWGYGSREELAPADAVVRTTDELHTIIRHGFGWTA